MSGRAVLVTGAARGIGRAIAEAFAEQGERVAVHHGHSAALAAEVLAGLPGSGHAVVQADLADPEAVRAMVGQAIEALGGLDVLVNNAGVFIPHPITGTSYEYICGETLAQLRGSTEGPGAASSLTWASSRPLPPSGELTGVPEH